VHAISAIARNDLRRRFRDRSVLLLGLIAPVLVAVIMSSAFGQFSRTVHVTVQVAGSQTTEGARFVSALRRPELASTATVRTSDAASVRQAVRHAHIDAGVVFPVGGGQATVLLAGRDAAKDAVARILTTHVLAGAPEAITDRAVRGSTNQAASYFAPSMAILFLFLLCGANTRAIVEERELGTLRRLAAAPITGRAILLGKLVAAAIIGMASMTALWLTTSVLLGANWGPAGGVLLVSLAIVLAATATMALVSLLVSTDTQAQSFGAVVTFTLAIVGGNFLQLGALPPAIRHLAPFTPNAWAMRAFSDLSIDGATIAVVGATAIVLAFAVGIATVGVWTARRRLQG
jgi:ABC-2 type transport system permease protein